MGFRRDRLQIPVGKPASTHLGVKMAGTDRNRMKKEIPSWNVVPLELQEHQKRNLAKKERKERNSRNSPEWGSRIKGTKKGMHNLACQQRCRRSCWQCCVVVVAGSIAPPSCSLIVSAGCCVLVLPPYCLALPSHPLLVTPAGCCVLRQSVAILSWAALLSSHHAGWLVCVTPVALSGCTALLSLRCVSSCCLRCLCCPIMLRRLLVLSLLWLVVACDVVALSSCTAFLSSCCTGWLLLVALPLFALVTSLQSLCPPILWLIVTVHFDPVVVVIIGNLSLPPHCFLSYVGPTSLIAFVVCPEVLLSLSLSLP